MPDALEKLLRLTPKTPEASTVPEPFGKPSGPGLWHVKGMELPPYIQHVAHEMVKHGKTESEAIHMAVGIVRNWAHGHDGHGHKVHADVQAAAAKNMAAWEAKRARAHAQHAAHGKGRDGKGKSGGKGKGDVKATGALGRMLALAAALKDDTDLDYYRGSGIDWDDKEPRTPSSSGNGQVKGYVREERGKSERVRPYEARRRLAGGSSTDPATRMKMLRDLADRVRGSSGDDAAEHVSRAAKAVGTGDRSSAGAHLAKALSAVRKTGKPGEADELAQHIRAVADVQYPGF